MKYATKVWLGHLNEDTQV